MDNLSFWKIERVWVIRQRSITALLALPPIYIRVARECALFLAASRLPPNAPTFVSLFRTIARHI